MKFKNLLLLTLSCTVLFSCGVPTTKTQATDSTKTVTKTETTKVETNALPKNAVDVKHKAYELYFDTVVPGVRKMGVN